MNIKFIEYFGKKLKKYSRGTLELVLIDNGQKALIIRWFLNGKDERLNCSLVGCITETESSWKIKFTKLYGDRRPMKISYKEDYKQAVKSIIKYTLLYDLGDTLKLVYFADGFYETIQYNSKMYEIRKQKYYYIGVMEKERNTFSLDKFIENMEKDLNVKIFDLHMEVKDDKIELKSYSILGSTNLNEAILQSYLEDYNEAFPLKSVIYHK